MNVISNSSPLVALSSIDQLKILQQMFGIITIPEAVFQETVVQNSYQPQRNRIQTAIDTFITVLPPTVHQHFSRVLGAGEQGVLNLAMELQPDIVLLDDKKARNEAHALGIISVFTSDVLKRAVATGLLSSYQETMEDLAAHQIYLPEGGGAVIS